MTVINPHNMTRHYLLWAVSLCFIAGLAGLLYWFQPPALLIDVTVPVAYQTVAVVLAGVCMVLALLFKFVFSQELIAWTFLELIGVLGTVLVGLFGYSDGWLIYHLISFGGLFLLGPYLHFA